MSEEKSAPEGIEKLRAAAVEAERLLGPSHPEALRAKNTLGVAMAAVRLSEEAKTVLEIVLRQREDALGKAHPDTLSTRTTLAGILWDLGEAEQCLQMETETLEMARESLGSEHFETILIMESLAETYLFTGRHGMATPLLEEALAWRRVHDEPGSEEILRHVARLAGQRLSAMRDEEANILREELMAFAREFPPSQELASALSMASAAWMTERVYPEGVDLMEASAKLTIALHGPDHPDSLAAQRSLDAACREACLPLRKI